MKLKFDITPSEYNIIHSILVEYLTQECKVYVFGSRAKNQAKYNSDLDVAIEYKEKINYKILRKIKRELEESKLAYKVDVLDINNISDEFREIIKKDMIEFPLKFSDKVPTLRFKEFSGDWEERRLSELGSFKNGLNKSKKDFGFGSPFVNLMDVFGKDVIISNNLGLINANKTDLQLYNLLKGDVLFIRSSVKKEGVGETALLLDDKKNTTYSGFLIRFRDDNDSLDLLYKKYCFKTKKFRNNLISLSTTSANTNINQESLNTLKLNLPQKKEQEKIALFLTQVDTKTEQLTKKERLLITYKKGVMQKIFSQEIRFRADDGSEFYDWEEKSLDKIVNRYDNLRIPVSASKRIAGNTPYYGANGIQGYVKDYTHYGEFILVAEDGANDLKNYPVQYVNGKIWINNHTHVLQAKKDIADNKFLKYAISKINIEPFLVGGGRAKLNANIMMKIKMLLPCLSEQTKIANFLSSIDEKIEENKKVLKQTTEFKKALLQQMFV